MASQGVAIASGLQQQFSFKQVALGAIGGAVSGGLSGVGFLNGAKGALGFVQGAARGALGSAITQGVGVATGLQDRFSWAGVATAGIASGLGQKHKTPALRA